MDYREVNKERDAYERKRDTGEIYMYPEPVIVVGSKTWSTGASYGTVLGNVYIKNNNLSSVSKDEGKGDAVDQSNRHYEIKVSISWKDTFNMVQIRYTREDL